VLICQSPPTSAVTFFRGSIVEAKCYLTGRVAANVDANPWLGSVFGKDSDSGDRAAYRLFDVAPM